MEFESVIGLEVHAQLLTRSKIFCSCSTQFGAPSNSNTCPVCLGLPGALPVLNQESVGMAIKAGLALNCHINPVSVFARKNYFYPDLPKGYQISQFDLPVAQKGKIEVMVGDRVNSGNIESYQRKSFGITRVHLEEDAGKSIHAEGKTSYVDLNRTGVALIEIVSEPDFRSSQEAYDYLNHLRRVLLYLEICDGSMEEGSLRCDANVSVRERGSKILGTKTEIKNLNSFRFLQKGLDYEIQRQIDLIERGHRVEHETRLWDEQIQKTIVMRTKEEAHDYRYFPEPDLLPVVISEEWLGKIKLEIPELPGQRWQRFIDEYCFSEEEALLITQNREFADYFESAVKSYNQPKVIFNWMVGDLTYYLKKDNEKVLDCAVKPECLADLIRFIDEGKISGKIAKKIFDQMYKTGEAPEKIISHLGLRQISNEEELEKIIENVIESNPEKVKAYQSGKFGLIGFFMGQVMKESGGQANPNLVNQILKGKLD